MHPDFSGLTLGDPSMFWNTMQRQGRPWTQADEYRENGIIIIKPYASDTKMSEINGINLVKQRLAAGTLKVHERCRQTVREIVKYRWKDYSYTDRRNKNMPEEPVDKDNHAVDCIRYSCLWRPNNSLPPQKPVDRTTLHYAIMQHKRMVGSEGRIGWEEYQI